MHDVSRYLDFSGRAIFPHRIGERAQRPLIIAIHGGSYSSAYFDVDSHSLLHRAARNGLPIIAIDRPGYGETAMVDDMSILGQARALAGRLAALWRAYGSDTPGVVLVGHSIGAAITLGIAAEPGDLPLLGVAISGIGVRTPDAHSAMWSTLPQQTLVDMPTELKDQLMFGTPDSFLDTMPAASYVANTPIPRAELVDITGVWQQRAADICAKIRVPVHYRQGAADHLWVVDQGEVDAFAARFSAAPRVDAALVAESGHCIDFHTVSEAFHLQQLGFALHCAAGYPVPPIAVHHNRG